MTPEGSVQLRKPRSPLLRVKVAEASMLPALCPGGWLLVRRTPRIRAGQIVLARHPGRPDMLIVKRAARRVEGDGEAGRGWRLAPRPPARGPDLSRSWRRGRAPPAPHGLPLPARPAPLRPSAPSPVLSFGQN